MCSCPESSQQQERHLMLACLLDDDHLQQFQVNNAGSLIANIACVH